VTDAAVVCGVLFETKVHRDLGSGATAGAENQLISMNNTPIVVNPMGTWIETAGMTLWVRLLL
jgi:hypothetical protein